MKKIKFLAPILAFAMFSCDQYLDVNESPNNVSFDQITPDKLLPGAMSNTYAVQVTTMNQLGNVFMNSWAGNVQSFTGGYAKEYQLNIDNAFYNGIWDGLYRNLMNFQAIIDYSNPNHQYDNYVAAAKICKAHYMQYIVDLYGDAPYSQAWKGSANTTPAYDDDFNIYKGLIAELEQARALIAAANANADDIAEFDIMLGGDMAEWEKFANTIQLRMCLRMSEATGAVATYRDTKLAAIASGPFVDAHVTINPGYDLSTDGHMNPSFNVFGYDSAGNLQQNRTFITMTGHAYKALQSYATTNWPTGTTNYEIISGSGVSYPNVTDGRSGRLFTVGSGAGIRRAVTQGSNQVDVGAIGTYPGLPCRLGLLGTFGLNGQVLIGYLDEYAACDGYVMTLSESCFLQAEAAVRYPSLFTGAQALFNAGVTADFTLRNATLGTYLTTINTKPNFGFTASTTTAEKLHAIMYQKWIALMSIHGIESFIDYNRTGYPLTPLATTATQTRKPYRLIYPVSEYVANSANVPSVSTSEAFTINAKTPFWRQ
jgi:hypothetical protein